MSIITNISIMQSVSVVITSLSEVNVTVFMFVFIQTAQSRLKDAAKDLIFKHSFCKINHNAGNSYSLREEQLYSSPDYQFSLGK